MSDRFRVRPATTADLESLVDLFEGYRAFYERPADAAGARDFLSRRLKNGDSAILLAVDASDHAVGFVQLYPVFSSLRMARALILNDLFVAPQHRGRGISRLLMNAALAFAKQAGAVSLSLETAKTNDAARALYESLGYTRDDTFLTYSLDVR